MSDYPESLREILRQDKDLVVLFDYVKKLDPDVILELGVRGGYSTEVFLTAGCNKLISVDINDYPLTRTRLGKFGNWEFIVQDDREYLKHVNYKPDIIFIDTSHKTDHTYYEICQSVKLLSTFGIILLHDTISYKHEVMKAIEMFILANIDKWTFTELGSHNGMGLIKRKY